MVARRLYAACSNMHTAHSCELLLGIAIIWANKPTSDVFAVGLFTLGPVVAVRRIIGTNINYSATFSTLTRWRMNAHSGKQNWVCLCPPPFLFLSVSVVFVFLPTVGQWSRVAVDVND